MRRPTCPRLPGLLAISLAASTAGACTADQPAPANDGSDDPVVNLPIVPRPDPPIDRAGLLAAVARAASMTAAGTADAAAERRLDGRPFEVRIRFGCRGPALGEGSWLGWSYDAEERRLRVLARPTLSADEPLIAALDAGEVEAVEGFWIPRPWLLQAQCPAAAAVQAPAEQSPDPDPQAKRPTAPPTSPPEGVAPEPVPASPRIGIAQFYSRTDPRTGRRQGRPFEAIKVLDEGQPVGSQGFNLVLSGRLRALPGLGVIGCSTRGPDSPPDCIVSADFDRVWIEQPDGGEIIAQWTSG